jgi:hypothetical protein
MWIFALMWIEAETTSPLASARKPNFLLDFEDNHHTISPV